MPLKIGWYCQISYGVFILEQLKEIIDVINTFSPTPLALIGLTLILAIILALKM